MANVLKVLWVVCLLFGCSAEAEPNGSRRGPKLTTLRAQRVTATVKREAATLVRVTTEHEVFITTPEHPFAGLGSGWTPAGRLVPGDRVVSAKFGAVRVLSVRSEKPTHPATVFNLSVDRSHAYLVGADQVLVHNTGCRDGQDPVAKRTEQIKEAQRELARIKATGPTSLEHKADLARQIAAVTKRITALRTELRGIRYREKKKARAAEAPQEQSTVAPNAPKENALARNTRALEAVESAIATLEQAPAGQRGDHQQLPELMKERKRLRKAIASLHRVERLAQGAVVPRSFNERSREMAEAEYESTKKLLEDAKTELLEVPGQEPLSKAQRQAIQRKIDSLQRDYDDAVRILDWEKELAELDEHISATDAAHGTIEQEKQALRAKISAERQKRAVRRNARKRLRDPELGPAIKRRNHQWEPRELRFAPYVADTQRARDTLERLEEELEARSPGAGSPTRDERIEYLTERIQTLKELVALRRRAHTLKTSAYNARERRKKLVAEGADTKNIDAKLAEVEQERTRIRGQIASMNVTKVFLGKLSMEGMEGTRPIDEARLEEIRRMFAEGLPDDAAIAQLEREVGEAEAFPAELLDDLLGELEAQQWALEAVVEDEAHDVDVARQELAEILERDPSPERDAAAASGLQALQHELRGERNAVEAEDFALANEHAFLSQTLARPGSSRRAEGERRLKELQDERMRLRTHWRQRMQGRLELAQQQLRSLQSIAGLRDAAAEADLARQVALLQHEVSKPAF